MPDSPQDYRPTTPLMEAVLLEDAEEGYRWAKELLEAGEDPNAVDPMNGRTPLFMAWWNERDDQIKLLLKHGRVLISR